MQNRKRICISFIIKLPTKKYPINKRNGRYDSRLQFALFSSLPGEAMKVKPMEPFFRLRSLNDISYIHIYI